MSLLAAAAAALLAPAAQAAQVSAANPQSLVSALQAGGYKAELTKDKAGDPMVRSAVSGSDFIILFFGCKNAANCETVQFYSGWKVDSAKFPLAKVNEWNKTKRFTRGYIADNGAAALEMDVDLDDGGMSDALFIDNIEFWGTLMAAFEEFIA